jgi:type IV pilus assembly protein PilQ
MRRIVCLFVFLLPILSLPVSGQPADRMESVREKLALLARADSTFLNEVDVLAGNIPLGDLLRNVARAGKVSIGMTGDNNRTVNCNLSRARIVDLLEYICGQYNLDLEVVGNIVSMFPYQSPPPPRPKPSVGYDPRQELLSYDLKGVPLAEAARAIADSSGVNLVVPPSITTRSVSGYVVRLPVDRALRALGESNGLDIFRNPAGFWNAEPKDNPTNESGQAVWNRPREYSGDQLTVDSLGMITVQIQQGNIPDILHNLCERMGLNYYFISPVEGQSSLFLKNVELNTLLKILFTGTGYSWYEEEGIYMFGASGEQMLASVRVVRLQNRTTGGLIEAIPEELKQGVRIHPFGELNSVILSGDQRNVARVEQFVRTLDRTVPLVTIEVIIVDATKRRTNETGLSIGIGDKPSVSSGTLLPGRMTLSAEGINSLIQSFNGFGSINLGKVNANFYADLRFLEETGDIELRSTPRLSTLNGHEAELTSGERRYYKEVRESLMGSQIPVQSSSYEWKYVDANMVLKIVPVVSGNQDITLAVEITQTEFTTQTDNESPPGTSTRSFKSEIRVQNEEMVLLGGIERNSREKSAAGMPFAARVPVLRWLFGQAKDNNNVRKLNVFIKPTVAY